jgi:uncharacterized protein (TIGR02246 family)
VRKLLVLGVALSCILPSPGKAGEMEDAAAALQHWRKMFDAGDIDGLVASYQIDAHLLGTLGGKPLVGRDEIRAYFANVPKGFHVTFADQSAQVVADTVVVESGSYEFAGPGDDGKTVTLPARFSFVLVKQGDQWLIANQHSSRRKVADPQ